MSTTQEGTVAEICESFGNDGSRMMDIVLAVQDQCGCVDSAAMDLIAARTERREWMWKALCLSTPLPASQPKGKVVIRLCNDVPDLMAGALDVASGLEEELGIRFGETTPDGRFSLEWTSCIGMSDQAPAALVNGHVMPRLGPGTARRGVKILREHEDLEICETS